MTDNLLQPDQGELQTDPNKDYLSELVGEGKKFKTPAELARGKFEADQFIEIMKKRQDELRADYLKVREENVAKAKLEDLVEQLSKSREQLASSEHTPAKEVLDKPAIDPKELDTLVSSKFQEYELAKRQQDNFKTFKDKLAERFGTNETALNQQIDNLGLTKEDLITLAKKSPSAALRSLGLDQQEQRDSFQNPIRSSQRNDNFAPSSAKKRTWAYYQELKKTNPDLYNDRKITTQMAKDSIELGEAFRDGDYYVKGLHEE